MIGYCRIFGDWALGYDRNIGKLGDIRIFYDWVLQPGSARGGRGN